MKFFKRAERAPDGRYLITFPSFLFYLITSAFFMGILGSMIYIYIGHGGIYFPPTDMVMFYGKGYSADELHYIADHEIGHHVWFRDLNDNQRERYINIYNDSNYYITEYSKTTVEENFAEEYAFYMACNKGTECISKDRVKFFKDNVSGWKHVFLD